MTPSSQDMMVIASLQFELDNSRDMPQEVMEWLVERIQTLKEGSNVVDRN